MQLGRRRRVAEQDSSSTRCCMILYGTQGRACPCTPCSRELFARTVARPPAGGYECDKYGRRLGSLAL